MNKKKIMGIDLGTQSIKVIIYDVTGKAIIQSASHPLSLTAQADGRREQLAQWWIDGLSACLQQIDKHLKQDVVAIGVSGQQHGFVPLDSDGEVLAPVKLWCDTATAQQAAEITEAAGGAQTCVDIAGNPVAVGFTASKIRWLKQHNPDAYDKLTTVLLPHDYVNYFLTGTLCMECGDASGTGVFDIRNRCWSEPLIEALDSERDLRPCFPPLVEAHSVVGYLRPQVAEMFDLPASALVSAGGGDNMMAAIGSGCVRPSVLTASLGTSGTLFAYADEPVVDPAGELAAFCSSTGGWLPLLCTMNCTVATEQLCDLFALNAADIDALAAAVAAGADGVITLPFYQGERTPALPEGRAVIFGLDTVNTTRGHLLRSAMEAAIYGLKTGLQAFRRCGLHFNELIVTGGGSNSRLWCQLCADILQLPVKVFPQQENAALGAALQALWCYRRQSHADLSIAQVVAEHFGAAATAQDAIDNGCSDSDGTDNHPSDNHRYFAVTAAASEKYEKFYQQYCALLNAVTPLYSHFYK